MTDDDDQLVQQWGSKARVCVAIFVRSLAEGDYEALGRMGRDNRLSAQELREVVSRYPHRLVSPPDEAFSALTVTRVADEDPWVLTVPFLLWTDPLAQAPLVLTLRLRENVRRRLLEVQIWDLSVEQTGERISAGT